MKIVVNWYSKYFFLLLLLFSSCNLIAQDEGIFLKGNIKIENDGLDGIHVLNKTSNRITITDAYGYFSIPVKLGDTLQFSAIQLKKKEIIVDNYILKSAIIVVYLEELENKLKEVVVMPYNLTGDLSKDISKMEVVVLTETTLGLPNAQAEIYTQADRYLYTARSWEYTGNKIELDPIMNYFSGRTKMLNKRVERNLKNKRLNLVSEIVSDSTFINGLKIPKEHIMNFIFYCEADEDFDAILMAKYKSEIWNFISSKSLIYRKNNELD